MHSDPFVVLGVSRSASKEEIQQAYYAKRDKLSNDMFLEGDAGAEAAKQLQELDVAFSEAIDIVTAAAEPQKEASTLDDVRNALGDGRFDEAQKLLDDISYRDAEWHYLQSIVYYNKNWFMECKNQLEIASSIEPENEKYKKALNNLNLKMSKGGIDGTVESGRTYNNNNNANANQNHQTATNRTYYTRRDDNTCCNICGGLLCADCCCECMGGDLISCC